MARITTHPGEMLYFEFMEPMGISARALSRAMKVPVTRVTKLLKAQTGMTADTALRLEKVLGMSADFWLNLQSSFDLSHERDAKAEIYAKLDRLVAA
ncbi:HigA family addiction module antitoxin [Bosea sp. RCC_152_1]|uniref:HigA family addiction module antitoxin n=1 Tax=Bosea sp. RCC_152_1 TaxID=3239228 RepID=UPI003524C04B